MLLQQYSPRKQPQQFPQQRTLLQPQLVMCLIALILLQQTELCTGRHVAASKRLALADDPINGHGLGKRTLIAGGDNGGYGQPEEVFSAVDRMESNYDEYPMVVPKRTNLMLDRLIVALHRALEQERIEHRGKIGELSNQHNAHDDLKENQENSIAAHKQDPAAESDQGSHQYVMYSDDDPTVVMDYDFKDLNSINRATGETLMAKSFQRRANMGVDLGGAMGAQGVAMLSSAAGGDINGIAGGGVAGGRNNVATGGRLYWRCYFNAVSCF